MLVRLIYLICTAIGVALVAMFAAEARGVSWDLFTTLSYIQPQCHSLTGQCPAYARRPVLTVSALTSTALFDKPRAALLDAYSSNAAVDHTTVPAFVAEQVVNQSIIDDLLDLGIPAVHDCHDDFIDVSYIP